MLSLMLDTSMLTASEQASRAKSAGGPMGTAAHMVEREMNRRRIVQIIVSILIWRGASLADMTNE
jgi:hypothetical protein